MGVTFEWKGDDILRKSRAAQKAALTSTAETILSEARARVRVDTEALRDSLEILEGGAKDTATGCEIYFGSDNGLGYAAIQELGPADGRQYAFTPYLRPSKDIHAKDLAGEVARNLK